MERVARNKVGSALIYLIVFATAGKTKVLNPFNCSVDIIVVLTAKS